MVDLPVPTLDATTKKLKEKFVPERLSEAALPDVVNAVLADTGSAARATLDAVFAPVAPPPSVAQSVLQAFLNGLPSGAVVNLAGRTYNLISPLSFSVPGVTIRDGAFVAGAHRAATVTAADVTFERVTWTRSTTGGATLAEKSGVSVAAERFKAVDCTGIDAAHAPIYFANGLCDGSRVLRGYYSNSAARVNTCLIYLAAGASMNHDIVVDGITGTGAGCPEGVLFFNCSESHIRRNKLKGFRRLPAVTLTGWTNVSGNVWRATDRTDGVTRIVYNNGVELVEEFTTATSPAANKWANSGGYVYLNLNGTDPNTRTMVSHITSGYAVTMYASGVSTMSDNSVTDNDISDCDGFGIYMQLAHATARRNTTARNRLRGVCLTGIQSFSLPFAGIGWTGGSDCLMEGDSIDGVGTVGAPAPGVYHLNGGLSTTCTGRAVGVTVRGATKNGFRAGSGFWRYIGCQADENLENGFAAPATAADVWRGLEYTGCSARFNSLNGLAADAGSSAGGTLSVAVMGGEYADNTQRGIILWSTIDSRVIGPILRDNGGSGGYQAIHLRGSCVQTTLDGIVMRRAAFSGVGMVVDSTCTKTTLGTVEYDTNFSVTTVNLNGTTVKLAGTLANGGVYSGVGTPEGVLTAPVGTQYNRRDGGAGTCLYIKETGTGNTGWVAK